VTAPWTIAEMARGQRTRKATAPVVVLGLGAAVWAASTSLSFIAPSAASSRRDLLLGAGVAAGVLPTLQAVEPAHAAEAPEYLEMSGMPGAGGRAKLNGFWTVQPGQSVNERAVYKKDGEDSYLMFNDCGSFQLSNKVSGECTGFAQESKGKWTVDGSGQSVRLKPVKKGEVPAPSEGGGMIKLPQVGLTGKESDDDLLFGKDRGNVNVVDFIRAKSDKADSVLDSYMQLNEAEAKSASSLEAKLLR